MQPLFRELNGCGKDVYWHGRQALIALGNEGLRG